MKGEADLVIGSRFKGKIEKGAMPWLHRWIGNPILTWFLNLFFKAGVSDAHCGFRAIKREALERLGLGAEGMEFASEMIIEAVRHGLRIKQMHTLDHVKSIKQRYVVELLTRLWYLSFTQHHPMVAGE